MLPPKFIFLTVTAASFVKVAASWATPSASGVNLPPHAHIARAARFSIVEPVGGGRAVDDIAPSVDPPSNGPSSTFDRLNDPNFDPDHPSTDVRNQQDPFKDIQPPRDRDNPPAEKPPVADAITVDLEAPTDRPSSIDTTPPTATAASNPEGVEPDIGGAVGAIAGSETTTTLTSLPHPTSTSFYGNWKNHSNSGNDDAAPPPPLDGGEVSSGAIGRVTVAAGAMVMAVVLGITGML